MARSHRRRWALLDDFIASPALWRFASASAATLAERFAHEPIPLDDSLQLANQIAAALEHSRQKGVIHNDLKSVNIKITRKGAPEPLDFRWTRLATGNTLALSGAASHCTAIAAVAPARQVLACRYRRERLLTSHRTLLELLESGIIAEFPLEDRIDTEIPEMGVLFLQGLPQAT